MVDHIRSELVVDTLQMAIWNRRPTPGASHHSDHGSTYTSWAFGHRLREAGLLGSMAASVTASTTASPPAAALRLGYLSRADDECQHLAGRLTDTAA